MFDMTRFLYRPARDERQRSGLLRHGRRARVADGSDHLDARRGGRRRLRLSASDGAVPRRAARAPPRLAHAEPYHTLPDARLHYWRGGRGEPVVFVHGFGTEAAVNWYAQLTTFPAEWDVIAPDLPGFGASDRLPQTNCIALQVRCLRTFLDDLGIARATLVGHSMGGWISLAFASASSGARRTSGGRRRRRPSVRSRHDARTRAPSRRPSTTSVSLIRANFQRPPRLAGVRAARSLARRAPGRDPAGRASPAPGVRRRASRRPSRVDHRADAGRVGSRRSSDAAGAGTADQREHSRGPTRRLRGLCAQSERRAA